MKFLESLKKNDLDGRKVLLRVDFDVVVQDSKIQEDFRIKSQKESVDYLLNNGAKVMLVGHLSHNDLSASFFPVVEQIGEILGQTLMLIPHNELASVDTLFQASRVLLLDNIRQDPREIQNDEGLALSLLAVSLSNQSKGFDYYANDAFAVCHRNHASVVAITKHLPSYAGFLIKKEVENLERVIKAPEAGKIMVLGGAKISTKLPVIKNFLDKAEKILIGGALANNFFEAQGIDVGASVVDAEVSSDIKNEKILLPKDILVSSDKTGQSGAEARPVKNIDSSELILDIGPETAKMFADIISSSKLTIWNGPIGLSEVDAFASGTRVVAEALVKAGHSIIGGGDTIAAVDKLGLLDKYSFVSTGGGAMLEFLAGNKLPGLEALGYYDSQT